MVRDRFGSGLGLVVLFVVVALPTTGCVQTALLPSRHLAEGETVVAASLDEPGFLYVPRLNLQVTQGLGGGDLSANVGGTVQTVGGGLAGRYYLTDALTAEGQVQGVRVFDNSWTAAALLGIQQTTDPSDHLYVGGHVGGMRGTEILADADESPRTLPLVGGSIGVGHIDLGGAWRMQIELEASVSVPSSEEEGLVPPAHLSIGVFRRWE